MQHHTFVPVSEVLDPDTPFFLGGPLAGIADNQAEAMQILSSHPSAVVMVAEGPYLGHAVQLIAGNLCVVLPAQKEEEV